MSFFPAQPVQRLDIGQAGLRISRLRARRQILRGLLGSGLLHLLGLLAVLLLLLAPQPEEPASSNPVTVIFEPSPPASPLDRTEGKPATSAPEEGPQAPPPPGIEASQPPMRQSPAPQTPAPQPPAPPQLAEAPPAAPLPVPPIPTPAPPTLAPPPPAIPVPPTPVSPPPPRAAATPPPRAEPRAAAPSAEPALSAPMNFSFGGATTDPLRARPTGRRNTIDPTLGPDIANRVGTPPTDIHRPDASIKVTGAQVGTDWITMLHAWWNQHGYYPEQAARAGEDGTVRIHVVVDRHGRVLGVELIGKSGSQWLDLAAQAVFRGASLPPFPPNTPEPRADLDLTIRYLLYRR